MKRFDRSIKVLQDEIYRVTGKVAHDAVDKGHNPAYATKILMVKCLKDAISILTNHETNKFV